MKTIELVTKKQDLNNEQSAYTQLLGEKRMLYGRECACVDVHHLVKKNDKAFYVVATWIEVLA